jgi:hypothetical protein
MHIEGNPDGMQPLTHEIFSGRLDGHAAYVFAQQYSSAIFVC